MDIQNVNLKDITLEEVPPSGAQVILEWEHAQKRFFDLTLCEVFNDENNQTPYKWRVVIHYMLDFGKAGKIPTIINTGLKRDQERLFCTIPGNIDINVYLPSPSPR